MYINNFVGSKVYNEKVCFCCIVIISIYSTTYIYLYQQFLVDFSLKNNVH